MEAAAEVTELLRQWEEQHSQANYDPVPVLTRFAEIIEAETENFMKKDPDPFDERHPSRMDPSCALGMALKVMFKKDNFMTKLVNDYVRDTYYSRQSIVNRDVRKLNIAACRLTLDVMPGLEMSVVFQDNEGFIQRLFSWAENSTEPLQTYATGLLAAAMEVQEIAAGFREQNARLVPLMLQRLHRLRKKSFQDNHNTPGGQCNSLNQPRYFARFAQGPNNQNQISPKDKESHSKKRLHAALETIDDDLGISPIKQSNTTLDGSIVPVTGPGSEGMMSPPTRGLLKLIQKPPAALPADSASNSSWAEMESYVIGNIQIHPPTDATRQMLILRYLTPMGEYQEFLSHVFSENALELILAYVNLRESRDSRLAFEALKYLAALLCHKKFSIEFINMNGLQRFLEVPRPSVAATGVSICMYYLAYCEDAMERVCLLPRKVLADLVRYALWLLECSHDSGRCNATMFFGFALQFRVILDEFDTQDGLRKLYNLISTLPILSLDYHARISDDESCAARQIVRHVCVTLRKYLESHLHHKADALRRQGNPGIVHPEHPPYKACKSSPEEIQSQIEFLQSAVCTRWSPCDQLLRLGGVTLLLQIVGFSYDWNFSGRSETVRSALDLISICCVAPRTQLLLCEKVEMPEEALTEGYNIVLGAAEGEIVADSEVQKAALNVLVNCICAPVHRVSGASARFSSTGTTRKKTNMKSYEDINQKVWECIRTNNGIMVLLELMLVKSPITDADCLRGLACRALAGLARCQTVRQIISKLPLFNTSQIQSLMRDPILQEKRQEHVMFQKYALELMERVSGKTKPSGAEFEISLANIHRANVVAQTHITFNGRQLLQLIHQHLVTKGLTNAADALQKEADLPSITAMPPMLAPPPVYQQTTPTRSRIALHGRNASLPSQNDAQPTTPSNGYAIIEDFACLQQPITTPIKIRRCQSTSSANIVSATLPSPLIGTNASVEKRSLQKAPHALPTHLAPVPPITNQSLNPRVSLDSIITEFLTNQHALCKTPMVTCPPFNLFEPHKCPDGLGSRCDPVSNVTVRVARRQAGFGRASCHLDARLLHSHFCPVKSFRLGDDDAYFTCGIFHPLQQTLITSTNGGDVKLFNIFSGQEESVHHLHDTYIHHMQANKEGTLLLASSSTWRSPLSTLWGMKHYEMKISLEEEEFVEFSKLEDKIIGTRTETATVYDITTGKSIIALTPTIGNNYTKNRATFSPSDELVLSDGVLWDVNSGKEIHKFDKLNQSLSGVFHPNGLEIISNTEIWDLRTFHLLRTVPILDKSEIVFSNLCGVIYAVCKDQEIDDEKAQFESSFKTLDAYDYSSIATIDVKRNICFLDVSHAGNQLAIVENMGDIDNVQESVVRLYDIGRRRDEEDEVEEDDDDDLPTDNENSDTDNEVDADLIRNVLNGLGIEGNEDNSDLDNDDDDDNDSFEDNDDMYDDVEWVPRNRHPVPGGRTRSRRRQREASPPTVEHERDGSSQDDEDGDADSDSDEISVVDVV